MNNVKQLIDNNQMKQNTKTRPPKTSNWRKEEDCPLDGQCLIESIVYQAKVSTDDNKTETYVGLTEGGI